MPDWLRARLGRAEIAAGEGAVGRTTGVPEGLEETRGARGAFAWRETRFDAAHRHGDWRLDEVDHADPAVFHLLTGDASLAALDLRRTVYLDIETTGLAGGAGTWPFLVALGTFEDDGFQLWQGFLREPGEEAALLEEVARRVAAADGLVSFFGKSFDRHRLEDKMRIHGVEPPFEERPHLDLYHPCRRLYGGAFDDGRLATMERALCGLERADDLPGSHAPAAWYDYLAGRAHRLEDVFRHNLNDVLSLATLAAQLGRSLVERRAGGEQLGGPALHRAAGLARSWRGLGRRDEQRDWLARAVQRASGEAAGASGTTRALRLEHARATALAGDRGGALAALAPFVDEPEDEHIAPALLELAKLLEHHARDRAAALAACERAAAVIDRRHTGTEAARLERECAHRAARLRPK